jgi:hypothetical protein
MTRPNLFSLATKELSQDAFLAWLMQWAAPECRAENPALSDIAADFVRHLIGLQGEPPTSISSVKAGRQWENIDVWAEVNDSHFIIIEDKVGTGEHSGQLVRYREAGENWCREHRCTLICVYIKTQSDSAANLRRVTEQGYAVLDRRELLKLLDSREANNDIYNDFRDRLREIEHSESRFTEKAVNEWDGNDWKGLYQALDAVGVIENWGYVNNPSGGFWNALLNWFESDDAYPFMQIEQGNLCFKIGEIEVDHSTIRNRYHDFLMNHGGSELGMQKPARFGCGSYMTVAVIPRSIWLGGDAEIINLKEVVARLERYKSWFVEVLDLRAPTE